MSESDGVDTGLNHRFHLERGNEHIKFGTDTG